MENDGNAADDQGWLQVKKRHRSSAKISVQSNPANKTRSSSQCNQPSAKCNQPSAKEKITSDTFGQKSVSSRGEGNVTTQAKTESRNLFSLTQEVKTGRKDLENEVINQESELHKLSLCEKGKVPVGSAYLIEEALDKIPKIKWGDLEDEELERSKNTGKSILSSPSQIVNQQDSIVTRFDEVQQLPDVIASSAVQDESTSEDVQLPKAGETIQPSDDALGLSSEIHCNKEIDVSHCDNSSTSTTISSAVTSSELPIISPMGDLAPKEPGALSQENREPETSGGDSITAPINLTGLQDTVGNASLSNSQLMNALDGDESGDYKESFRERLWTFLFWNLNRAVDELYLLCELECDVEQMKEAILVLEEAGSDFKALKSRVEDFEKMRKSSGQLLHDGNTVNVKSDHRRPHALSWEVRRMTTSSHRAEILSSSLEAFKKITQERASKHSPQNDGSLRSVSPFAKHFSSNPQKKSSENSDVTPSVGESGTKSRKHAVDMELGEGSNGGEKQNAEISKLSRGYSVDSNQLPLHMASAPDLSGSHTLLKDTTAAKKAGYSKRSSSLGDKDKEKEKRSMTSLKSTDVWNEKRNWEDILSSPLRNSSRISHSPALGRRSVERARVLHDKLMSPEKKKKTALDMKREAEEKHARAMRIKSELENERVQRLQRTSEKLNRVSEWQAVRSSKLREEMQTRHQRSESRHEAHLAQVVKRAGDESSKVNEVRFITSLNEENKKLILKQKLQDSELRRAEKLQEIKIKQKEDSAREEAVLERRKLLEAEKLQRLAENQRKKEEAQVRREEERKASSAAREARAIEQLRRKEVRAKAQQEEAELLAQKLAERLSESEMRRKFYLEQIKERASMDFRDQSSPSVRKGANREGMGKLNSANSVEDLNSISGVDSSSLGSSDAVVQQSWKRRTKKIRQRLMALKYDFFEPPVSGETAGIGYRTQVVAARAKIARWLQDLQKLRQARKEGAASIGLIVGDMIKFLEGKDLELQASRQAGLLDFIASALPASHISKPEACQVTIYLLRLLKVVLALPVNRGYFIAQNLLPPIIPMLSAALENYIKISAASNLPLSNSSLVSSKISSENLESIAEVLEGFLWTVTVIIGHTETDERQSQMQDILVELVVAYQVIHRLRDLFALFDRPQLEGVPFPSSVLLGLNLLAVLTSRYRFIISINWEYNPFWSTSDIKDEEKSAIAAELEAIGDSSDKVTDFDVASITAKQNNPLSIQKDSCNQLTETSSHLNSTVETSGEPQKNKIAENITTLSQRNENSRTDNNKEDQIDIVQEAGGLVMQKMVQNDHEVGLKLQVAFVVSAIGETGLVGLPSLLTAVLLQANSKSSSEQGTYLLPSNFEEVATGVLKVLNNLALLDINLLQKMLARPDLRMEFFHLMSFLLSHCTAKWKVVTDQVGMLLLETLLLLGYFSLFHPGNQAVLRWGKSPTILHKVCDLPFVFFSDPELTPILAGTLVAACYGSEQNKGVVLQEISMDMLLSLLKSCRQSLTALHSDPYTSENNAASDDPADVNQPASDLRKLQRDAYTRLNIGRNTLRGSRASLGKGGIVGSHGRQISKMKNQRESKGTKSCDEYALKHNLPPDSSSPLMLHNRFPISFIDRVQEFFSAESTSM